MQVRTFARQTTLVWLLALALAGCGFSDETEAPPQDTQGDGDPAGDAQDSQPQTLQPPILDPISATAACGATVPLTGSAMPGVSVFVTGGTSSVATDTHPVTGQFCLDLPLVKNSVNTFEVRAQDPVLGLSDPVNVAVTHQDCKQDDAGPADPAQPKPKNVAIGSPGFGGTTAKEGNEGFLTDGDDKTFVKYCGSWGFWGVNKFNGWATVKLDKLYKAGEIVVRWRDGKDHGHHYGGKYKVLVSSMTDPGDPSLTNGYWVEVGNVTQGDGDVDTFDLTGSEPLVQHVALWMISDGGGGITDFDDCFAVSEIEVWDVPAQTNNQLPQGDSTCSTLSAGF